MQEVATQINPLTSSSMKSAFLITATMLSGIVGVFGTPAVNNITFYTAPTSHLARFANSSSTAPTPNIGVGPVQKSICYATNAETLVIGVGQGIDQEGAKDAALKDCGDGCKVDNCGDTPKCYAFATGAVDNVVVLAVRSVDADSQQDVAQAESLAVKECSTLVHGHCDGLGHRCL